jgi:hypothetical protein
MSKPMVGGGAVSIRLDAQIVALLSEYFLLER